MRDGTLIGPLIIAIGLVVAAVTFAVVGTLLQSADGTTELRLASQEREIDALRGDILDLRDTIRDQAEEMRRLSEEIALRPAAGFGAAPAPLPVPETQSLGGFFDEETLATTEEMTEVMRLAKERFNTGVTQPNNRVMLDILGHPRESYSTDCQPVTNPAIRSRLETRQVGPIRVTMLQPALDSLGRILARLEQSDPDIYSEIGTAGALCARLIRGSTRSVSNHSWGTAIDIKLEGKLDRFADGGTQFGLLILAEYFNEEGWYWGAVYSREDSMHFEVGVETLRQWRAEGKI